MWRGSGEFEKDAGRKIVHVGRIVSEAARNLNEIYDDIELCYKVMGLTFSDSPEKVDKVYQGFLAEYNEALRSSDPATRQNAKMNIEQVQDLYERITSSLIYQDYAREYEKYKHAKAEQMQSRKEKQQAEKKLLVSCPHCHNLISPKLKVCFYCHGKILTPMEQLLTKVFTTRNLVVAAVVVLLVIAGLVLISNSPLLKW